MSTVLEDVTSETISVGHVVQRVEDWEARVTDFYAMIDGWLRMAGAQRQARVHA